MRIILGLSALFLAGSLGAQDQAPAYLPTTLKVHANPAPTPKLKYPLVFDFREQVTGNAALSYHRAMTIYRESIGDPKKFGEEQEKLYQLFEKPDPEKLPEALKAYVHRFANVLKELEYGTKRSYCDWDLDNRLDAEGIAVLLPEVQKMREMAFLLKCRCRLNIIEKKMEEALLDLRMGFSMARHIGEGPTFIQSLVGVAHFQIFAGEMDLLLQLPNTPNLYWSFTALPKPFIQMRKTLEGEMRMVQGSLPFWKNLEKGIMTSEQASEAVNWFGTGSEGLTLPEFKNTESSRLMIASLVAMQYPKAKRSLVAMGRGESEVNAMPAAQVVMLEGMIRFKNIQDEMFVWFGLPFPEATQGFKAAEARLKKIIAEDNHLDIFGARLMELLLPAAEKLYYANVRVDRRIVAFRTLEAIRLHAAENGGQLPKSLSEITIVPIPPDPVTGKPMDYVLEGSTAKLTAIPSDDRPANAGNAIRYTITIQK